MSKRKCLSLDDKLKIINEVDRGLKKKDIAEKFGIPASSLSTILKNRDVIFKAFQDGKPSVTKRVKMCVYNDIDSAVFKWIQMLRKKRLPVSAAIIKERALQFAESLGHREFTASTGWLDKFKKRHADVNDRDCDSWKENVLRKLMENSPQQFEEDDEEQAEVEVNEMIASQSLHKDENDLDKINAQILDIKNESSSDSEFVEEYHDVITEQDDCDEKYHINHIKLPFLDVITKNDQCEETSIISNTNIENKPQDHRPRKRTRAVLGSIDSDKESKKAHKLDKPVDRLDVKKEPSDDDDDSKSSKTSSMLSDGKIKDPPLDEFELYGRYVAAHLRQMNLVNALEIQLKITALLTENRIKQLECKD